MSQTDRVTGGLALAALDLAEGTNRGWVQLMRTTDGVVKNGSQKFEITPDDLAEYAQTIKDAPGRVPIDRDHSYVDGKGTVAAGWVVADSAQMRNDGKELWAEVEWTPAAAQQIRDGEYRYISPEFTFQSAKDGVLRKAKKFLAAALTNRPFFADMAPVTLNDDQEVTVDPIVTALKKSLGLPDEADDAAVTAAIAAKDEEIAGLKKSNTELATQATAATATLQETATKVAALEARVHNDAREQVLKAAIDSGKILPVQRDAYVTMYDANPESVVALLDATPEKSFAPKGTTGDGAAELPPVTLKGVKDDEVLDGAETASKVTAYLAEQKITAPTQEQYLAAVAHVSAAA